MDLSFSEMIVIGVIAFLVLGPQEMARKAAQLGRFLGRMKTQVNNFKVMAHDELLKDIDLDNPLKDVDLSIKPKEPHLSPVKSDKNNDENNK